MEHNLPGARDPLTIAAGQGIELRPMTVGHGAALYDLIDRNRIRLREWLPWVEGTFGPADLTAFLNARERDNAEGIGLTAAIYLNDALCGAIGLHAIEKRDRSTSIGYWLDAGYSGQGIMTRACSAIVTEGFRGFGLHRIEIRCATGNSRSSAIPRRLGFVEEGILREAEWLYDHWVDLRVFSMLEHQWEPF
jgi:ribosomal-protein-serine acetyltransferase